MPINKKMGFGGIVSELKKDNQKQGKAKGQNGKPRTPEQIKAIAMNVMFGKKKK